MGFNKKFFTTGGIVASTPSAAAGLDPLQNFETVTYTGNGSTQKITGYIRKGAAFNGSSSIISVSGQLPSVASDYSISFWANPTTISTSGNTIFTNINAGGSAVKGQVSVLFYDYNSVKRLRVYIITTTGSLATAVYDTTSAIATGTFSHIVVNIDIDGAPTSYVNGVPFAMPFLANTSVTSQGSDTIFGKHQNASFFNGKLDQVRIFNTTLNSTQVGQLAAEDYTDPKKSTTDYFGDGSGIALYELDDDAYSSNFEQAAVFNGSSSIITLGQIIPINSDLDFSFSQWINPASLPSSGNATTLWGTPGSDIAAIRLIIRGVSGGFEFELVRGLNGQIYYSSNTSSTLASLSTGIWYNLTFTYVSSTKTVKTYLNGVELGNGYTLNVISSYTIDSGLALGAYQGTNSLIRFSGKIDQVRIYSSALDSTDVEKLYKESADVPTANLVAHYKLDGDATDETETYDGTASNVTYSAGVYGGTPTNVNFLGMAFQPDLVITKSRDSIYSGNHFWSDSVRGAGKVIYSDGAYAEATNPIDGYLGSFDSNGFSLSSGTRNTNDVSNSGENYVAWCWKAADTTTTIAAGTVGNAIASDVRANQDAGFSIVKWQSNGIVGATVGHGLSSAPEMIIMKDTSNAVNWLVYHSAIGATGGIQLNLTAAAATYSEYWNNTSPTSNVFSVSTWSNESGSNNMIAYCFHSVDGYQKVGSYTGTGASGNVVTTGFRPRFILLRRSNTANNWDIFDSTRDTSTYVSKTLKANTSDAESTYPQGIYFQDNGFEPENTYFNDSGDTIIYLAIA